MTPTFYKTKVTIEILSEEKPGNTLSLDDIAYEIQFGHWSGLVHQGKSVELTGKQAAKALIAQGSDPEFFGLDKNGNMLEEE